MRSGCATDGGDVGPDGCRPLGFVESDAIRIDHRGLRFEGSEGFAGAVAAQLQPAGVLESAMLGIRRRELCIGDCRVLGSGGLGLAEFSEDGVEPAQPGLGRDLLLNEAGGVLRRQAQAARCGLERGGELFAAFGEGYFDLFEPFRAEQGAEHRLAFIVLREKELLEAVLREKDHLKKLVFGQPEDEVEFVGHIDGTGGDTLPLAVVLYV